MEAEILLWIQENLRVSALNPLMKAITHLCDFGMVWLLAAITLMLYRERRKAGLTILAGIFLSFLFNNLLLKNLVGRTRPYEVIEGLQLLTNPARDLSFPSGHAATSFVAAVIIAGMLPKRYGISAVLLAALISFSRLYIGIHYPTDVLFGAASGALIGVVLVKLVSLLDEGVKSRHS